MLDFHPHQRYNAFVVGEGVAAEAVMPLSLVMPMRGDTMLDGLRVKHNGLGIRFSVQPVTCHHCTQKSTFFALAYFCFTRRDTIFLGA